MHLKTLGIPEHNQNGPWEVRLHGEFAPEFGKWTEGVQDAVLSLVLKLRVFGPSLGRPSVDTLRGSDYPNMKELRLNAEGGVWRIAFAFDPKRRAILLVGGDKKVVSKDRFYSALIRVADSRYKQHLSGIEGEGWKK
jgi:hypothetical protein